MESPDHLPRRSRTIGGDLPPEVARVEQAIDPEVPSPADHGVDSTRRHRRRKSRSRTGTDPSFSQASTGLFRANPRTLATLLGILCILLLAGNFFVGRFFYQSGLSAGMQRALSANQAEWAEDATSLPQAKILSAVLNLRTSPLDRATVDLLTPVVLVALQSTPQESLPDYLRPGLSTVEDFAAAYVAMRRGDFGQAAAILRDPDKKLPPDQFSYLMNDATLREFAREPRVMGFY